MTDEDLRGDYVPDYRRRCVNCGQVPTVTIANDGRRVLHMEMCGPCVWGEAETIDPDTWQAPKDKRE